MAARRLGRLLAGVLVAGLVVVAGGAWFATRTPASPFDGAASEAAAAPDLGHRGEYIARLSDCVACHSTAEGAPFAGGLEMATPIGSIFATNITPDPAHGIGAYIVQGPGHCGSCHTPRSPLMNEKALDERSAQYLSGALLDGWYAPSLRRDTNVGLGRWSEDEIAGFLATGRNAHAVVFGSMTDAFNNSTQFMAPGDLKAIAHYLASLPGDAARDGPPWQYDAQANAALSIEQRVDQPGAQTFATRCAACHGLDGRGQGASIPPLAGAVSSMATQNASSINVTLNGSGRVVAAGVPDAYRMPPFRQQLGDHEIAEVLSFIRTSWGNRGGAVKTEEVATLRARTNPASSTVIVLQMR